MTAYSAEHVRSARSFLFVPGNKPERFDKAAASGADVVIIDLEDAVAAGDKVRAREHARDWLGGGRPAMIRVNGAGTPWHADDRDMVVGAGASVLVPKAEKPDVLEAFAGSCVVVALVETASGVAALQAVCSAPGVHRIAFGSVDLAAQLGIDPTDREAFLAVRSQLVICSAAAGLAEPIDGVTTALSDQGSTIDDVGYARRLGFTAKLCIHPSQVPVVHDALAPTAEQIAWAQRVLAVADPSGGASSVDGQMVDLPVLRRAHSIVGAANLA